MLLVQAFLDAPLDDPNHQWIRTQWRGDQKRHVPVPSRGVGCQRRDVPMPMAAREKEIGVDHHQPGSAPDAAIEGRLERRLGQIHVGRLDDRKAALPADQGHDLQQRLVALRTPRPVVHDDHTDLLRGKELHG